MSAPLELDGAAVPAIAPPIRDYLEGLNAAQRKAVEYGIGDDAAPAPLLIIAGAGTGKTNTLAHRFAHLILKGANPQRILLLTFTRRAAAEMTRRAQRILARALDSAPARTSDLGTVWSGTFHSIGNRLLRLHAHSIGLDPSFTVLDRSDSADLMNLVRNDLGFAKKRSRFPKKDTCLAIYSHVVNARHPLRETLEASFPWCLDWESDLKRLFAEYVTAKQRNNVLDYDDLLLWWAQMVAEPAFAAKVGAMFDHVLVDEYQDTNALQADILFAMKPDGRGLTVVGDDAQSIYSFRAATVRNILDFPSRFSPRAAVAALEQNYRSTQAILDACNAVIGLATETHPKRLFSEHRSGEKPLLVAAADDAAQVDYVVQRILDQREAGIELKQQAVLFRTSHHSALLEIELARRNIPFVKFGGLKFLEAAHVKDVLCILRWTENPQDTVAGFRVLQLLPGMGPTTARRLLDHLASRAFALAALGEFRAPAATAPHWAGLCHLSMKLRDRATPWVSQLALVKRWYEPLLEIAYDDARLRAADIDKLEQIAAGYQTRERFLSELTLDPPEATGANAEAPFLDEDYLILSTIHSAKGQEWSAVFVVNVVDGCIPSDMAAGSTEEIEEERRLLYVAMTRAKRHLHLIHPIRFYRSQQQRMGDTHVFAPLTRFIPHSILDRFERQQWPESSAQDLVTLSQPRRIDVAARMRDMWR
jgi:DNA helicase-2/ATP-dependent DNA helicase PcrA